MEDGKDRKRVREEERESGGGNWSGGEIMRVEDGKKRKDGRGHTRNTYIHTHTIHTTHTQHTHTHIHIHIHTQYTTHTQHIHTQYNTYTHNTHNTYTTQYNTYTHNTHNTYTTYTHTQHTQHIHTQYTQHIHNTHIHNTHTHTHTHTQGYHTLDDLRNSGVLTRVQLIGLKHFEDFNEKMPRSEVEEIEAEVRGGGRGRRWV